MALAYLHLSPGDDPPQLTCGPLRALIVSELEVTDEWRARIAEWLLDSGCLYAMAWGVECVDWHDAVDWANLKLFGFGDIPEERWVLTTWHSDEPLREVMWFAGHCALHNAVELEETLILHIASEAREAEMLDAYWAGQPMPDHE